MKVKFCLTNWFFILELNQIFKQREKLRIHCLKNVMLIQAFYCHRVKLFYFTENLFFKIQRILSKFQI